MGRRLADSGTQPPEQADHLARIANLLALLLVRGESQTDKVVTLSSAGFTPGEIAGLLGTTSNAVSVALYKAKRDSKARGK